MLEQQRQQQTAVTGIAAGLAVAYRVWLFDDCDFVAALSLDEAEAWYDDKFGKPCVGDKRLTDEVDLQCMMRDGEGTSAERITFAERIQRLVAQGESFPAVIAVDAGYI